MQKPRPAVCKSPCWKQVIKSRRVSNILSLAVDPPTVGETHTHKEDKDKDRRGKTEKLDLE